MNRKLSWSILGEAYRGIDGWDRCRGKMPFLTQEEAVGIMRQSMKSPLYGWALSASMHLTNELHAQLSGIPVCRWVYRSDLGRLQCPHGIEVMNLEIQTASGAQRN